MVTCGRQHFTKIVQINRSCIISRSDGSSEDVNSLDTELIKSQKTFTPYKGGSYGELVSYLSDDSQEEDDVIEGQRNTPDKIEGEFQFCTLTELNFFKRSHISRIKFLSFRKPRR